MSYSRFSASYIQKSNPEVERGREGHEEDEELLDQLDDDFELGGLREKRMEQLRQESVKRQQMEENHHGKYMEIKDEKEVIKITANAKFAVVHFFHADFMRCKIMDKHLESIATRHFSTRFLRVDVANVPWLVNKLEIKVLPCVFVFVDGVTKDRIIGFEGLTETASDGFSTASLELRLKQTGVLPVERTPASYSHSQVRISPSVQMSQEDDWDA
ncbi:hypothetical protein CROQUDRAFT_666162 [Cronartium quercuum f. sp. fusiforme G11]|uniref:Thioredoxin domain-containing protein n=1 Tax=Cronartium quercuum f. sp. fusiforme G11 TaxID=708437 RepID=A0A9P6T5A5_9BASI|nr:hypothetical protein CROQUDRAFT_666162 [Cronartium quercuum f. sp. fusiforme G11]